MPTINDRPEPQNIKPVFETVWPPRYTFGDIVVPLSIVCLLLFITVLNIYYYAKNRDKFLRMARIANNLFVFNAVIATVLLAGLMFTVGYEHVFRPSMYDSWLSVRYFLILYVYWWILNIPLFLCNLGSSIQLRRGKTPLKLVYAIPSTISLLIIAFVVFGILKSFDVILMDF